MARNGVVRNAHGNPHRALLRALSNHLHHPHLVLVGDGERFAGTCISVLVHKVGHHLYGLAGRLRAFEGYLDQRTVVDDRIARRVLKLLVAAPCGFAYGHLMLIDVAHHVVCLGRLGNLAERLARVPFHHLAHRARRMLGRGRVREHSVKSMAVGGISYHHRAVHSGLRAGNQISAGVGMRRGQSRGQSRSKC